MKNKGKKVGLLPIIIIAIITIPTIYGLTFLGAIWNAYDNLDQLPVAVVNLDKGAKMTEEEKTEMINADGENKELFSDYNFFAGKKVTSKLIEDHSLNFKDVSLEDAKKGLENGKYTMEIIIPENFSESIKSASGDSPKQANIKFVRNPGSNFIASKLCQSAAIKVEKEVSQSFSSAMTKIAFTKLDQISSSLKDAHDGAQKLSDGANKVSDGASTLSDGMKRLNDSVGQVNIPKITLSDAQKAEISNTAKTKASSEAGNVSNLLSSGIAKNLQTRISSSQLTQMIKASPKISAVKQQLIQLGIPEAQADYMLTGLISGIQENIAGSITTESLNESLKPVTSAILSETASKSALTTAENMIAVTNQTLSGFSGKFNQLKDATNSLSSGSSKLYQGTLDLSKGASELSEGLKEGQEKFEAQKPDNKTAEVISNPVNSTEEEIHKVKDNGSAMAPLMMSIGLWVAAMSLCIMVPMNRDEKKALEFWLKKMSLILPVAIIFGLLMLFSLEHFMGMTALYRGKTYLTLILGSVTFMSLLFLFTSVLKRLGIFMMYIFLVFQIAGSGGTYPLWVCSPFFDKISSYLPFTHLVEAFRASMFGEPNYAHHMTVLLSIFICSALISLIAFVLQDMYRNKKRVPAIENNNAA